MKQHWPHIAGFPICYIESDRVKTRDGRIGIVIGYEWEHDLVIYKDGEPSKGFFMVTVDFGDHTEKFFRHDLSGERFRNEFR